MQNDGQWSRNDGPWWRNDGPFRPEDVNTRRKQTKRHEKRHGDVRETRERHRLIQQQQTETHGDQEGAQTSLQSRVTTMDSFHVSTYVRRCVVYATPSDVKSDLYLTIQHLP